MFDDSPDSSMSLGDIFARAISAPNIIRNPQVLRSDYIPPKLLFRDQQISNVAQVAASVLRHQKPSNLLLYGRTGTGKTAVVRSVLLTLQRTARERGVNITTSYCNTRLAGTEYRVLVDLAGDVDVRLPFTGLALAEAYSRVTEHITRMSLGVTFVLDEIDYLVKNFGDDLLYEFTRASDSVQSGFISIIGISNDLRFKEFLDPRVLSSLSEEEVVFPPYTVEELQQILLNRASFAFLDNTVSPAAINLCAALAGSEHGDARRAVDLLRVSAEVAEREGVSMLEERHVRIAQQKMEQDRVSETLRSLPLQAKLVLLAVISTESSKSTGDLYNLYRLMCRKVSIDTLTQRRVSTLLSELDLQGLLSASTVSYGRYGRTKKIQSLVPAQTVRQIFIEDPVITTLVS